MNRRTLLTGASVAALSGCKVLDDARGGTLGAVMASANSLTYRVHRALGGGHTLAPEYTQADIRQGMHPNGSTNPQTADYLALQGNAWADYRLEVGGMVGQTLSLSLADLRAMQAQTQITRHDCVEGWSCIAKWTGVRLGHVLAMATPQAGARFVVFHCFDAIERGLAGEVLYHESIDMVDATHPQTILAWGVNDEDLPVRNGAPLRVRVERQLGYKMAKYIRRIDLVADFTGLGRERGGYWPDKGYDWFAGI